MTELTKKVRASFIKYSKTLICYDGIQLFLGVGSRNRYYICLAVPHDEISEAFLCTPISNNSLEDYIYERIDLLALIKSSTTGKHYLVDLDSETSRGYLLNELQAIPNEWLPDRHIFSRAHTEDFIPEVSTRIADLEVKNKNIHIDGRWDTRDLAALPDLFTDSYSFLYALKSNELNRNSVTEDMFNKYPWRGGFSTVGFYNGLYAQIPRKHRLSIQGISYHSPGEITLSAVDLLADQIKKSVSVFIDDRKEINLLYRELYDGMSLRELLGRSTDEVDADALDFAFVEKATRNLANKMQFIMLDQLLVMTESNWLICAKILMSYCRRLKSLSDFFDSGKASFES